MADKEPMTDTEYKEFQQLRLYDGASLGALALWLNSKKKNRELMKAVSAEMGRNARHWARAVDYFKPFFIEGEHGSHEYLVLFELAKLPHEQATTQFANVKFDYPLWRVREIVDAAKPKRTAKSKKCPKCGAEL
jgi:hypothetical protein